MPRSATPRSNTRWVIFDLKNMRLHSWVFFPSKAKAQEWIDTEYRHEKKDVKPSWYPKKDWQKRKDFLENHIVILRARWHVSRHDALEYGLVERKENNESREDEAEGD